MNPIPSSLLFEDFPIEDIEPEQTSGRITFGSDDSRHNNVSDSGSNDPSSGRKRRGCWRWTLFMIILAALLAVAFYLRYCTPFVVEAQERGYITKVEKRGLIFKTYEGDMVVNSAIADTTSVYDHRFSFSIADEALARQLRQLAGTSRMVTLVYEKYYATLPWRGDSKIVAIGVEPVDE